ncbi:threonine-phosphate decarboxylase [filamentous cyanobacterium CCP5]|nr:threonine-phosphate decarboxylase [filamentous cyanobacterium CCP5]
MNRPVHGGNLTWAAEVAGCSPDFILDFSASISPLGPPQSVLQAIQAALANLRHYPDPGYTSFCQAIAQHHGLSPQQVLPGNGAAELLTWACRDLAKLGAVGLPVPAFGDYYRALQGFDGVVVPQGIQADGAWLGNEAFLDRLVHRRRSLQLAGLLLNNPHNPTGRLFSKSSLLPLLDQFDLVVVDEAFMDFLPANQQESLVGQVSSHPNLVVLRSLTKFYSLPGLRLGYAVGSPERLERWRRWRDPWPVNSLAVSAAVAALADTAFQQHTWDWLAATRPALYTGLQSIAQLDPLPGVANFFLVCCDRPVPLLQAALLKHHRILIRDCLSFPELGDRYFRIAVKTEAENQQLLAALAVEMAGQ